MKQRAAFFGKKGLIQLGTGVLLAYMLVVMSGLVVNKIAHIKAVNAAKAEQARLNRLSPAEKSIRKAVAHQTNMITASEPFQRLLYDYLQRSYNLDPKLSVAKTPLSIRSEGERGYSEELYYMARIAFPEIAPVIPPKQNPQDISFTNIYAANCDHIALPNNFWQVMQQEYQAGGYYLTHDALAFRFLRDNNCTIPDDGKVLESQVNRGMIALIEGPNTIADLRYEAITFLLLLGQRDQVKQAWIDQIAAEQRPDGSWAASSKNKASNDHATLLAMWSLLQYSHPEVKYQPLIRHTN